MSQVAVQSALLLHRPQKPLALQLGAPAGHSKSAPDPLLPLQPTHEPAVGPLGMQKGADAFWQAAALPLM